MRRISLIIAVVLTSITSQTAQAEVIFGPRVSYYFDNSNLRTSDLTASVEPILPTDIARDLAQSTGLETTLAADQKVAAIGDQIAYPMFGASISTGNDKDRFTLTGMYGAGNGSQTLTLITTNRLNIGTQAITDFQVFEAALDNDIDRYDLEVTWQSRLNEKLAIFGGLRYERLEVDALARITADITYNIDNFVNETLVLNKPNQQPVYDVLNFQVGTNVEVFSARAGVSAFVPVNQSMTAFFNGMVHASYQPSYSVRQSLVGSNTDAFAFKAASETSLGPDIAVGLQWGIAENISMDLRYRAIFFFPIAGDFSFDDARVNHGINMGVSVRL